MRTATATIWRYSCDPDGFYSVSVYSLDGNRTKFGARRCSPIELGDVIDTLASPATRKLLAVDKIMIDREHLARKCREIECDHCHGAK